jgi:hypothetical protein
LWSERGLSGNEDRQHFDCATWLHKAREMSKEKAGSREDCSGSSPMMFVFCSLKSSSFSAVSDFVCADGSRL